MWNAEQVRLLGMVIKGTKQLQRNESLPVELGLLYRMNERCLDLEPLTALRRLSYANLHSVCRACEFLFMEFAWLYRSVRQVESRAREFPILLCKIDKLKRLREPDERTGFDHFQAAWTIHDAAFAGRQKIDCLFITAKALEFLAVVRKIGFFGEGLDPSGASGFRDNEGNEAAPGWLTGVIPRRGRKAHIAAVCCSRYGPSGAAAALGSVLAATNPRHIILVGVAASLAPEGESIRLDLGDVGYSTSIDDISLAKDGELQSVTSSVRFDGRIDRGRIPPALRDALRYERGSLELTGILRSKDLEYLKAACRNPEDQAQIEQLANESLTRAMYVDFQSLHKPVRCPRILVEAAERVRRHGRWRNSVQLPHPDQPHKKPKIVPTRVLSGSRVVRAFGMREYLAELFPGRLLVEMEGAGVAQMCHDTQRAMPIVVKSACDWGTPPKDDRYQEYCADVAAAFAVELAIELAHD